MKKLPLLILLVLGGITDGLSQATLRDNFDTTAFCTDLPGHQLWKGDLGDNTIWMIDSNAIRPKPMFGDPCGLDTNIGHGGSVRWDSALAGNFEFAFTLKHKTPPNAPQPVVQSNVEFWMSDTQLALYYQQIVGYDSHGYMVYWFNYPDSIGGNTWRWYRQDAGSNEFGFTLLKVTHHQWLEGEEVKFQVKKDPYNTITMLLNDVPIDSIRDSAWTNLRFVTLKGGVGHDTRLDDFKIGPYNPNSCLSVSFSPPTLVNGVLDSAYNETFVSSGGVEPYHYEVTQGALPAGLTLSGGGTLSGVPYIAGSSTFKISTFDANNCFATNTYTMSVNCGTIVVSPASVPSDTAGVVYTPLTFTSVGGAGIYTFTETGALPGGMTFVNGLLSGTPVTTGDFPFTVTATDSNGCGGSRDYTLVIPRPTVISSAGANGSIAPSGVISVDYHADQAFTITPGTGYHVDSLIVDGVDEGSISGYTFLNDTTNHSIRAVFAIDTFLIAASCDSGGSIAPAGNLVVSYGDSVHYTITPIGSYAIDDVEVDNVSVGKVTSYDFVHISSGHTIHAKFIAIDSVKLVLSVHWNLLSVPVTVENDSERVLFPTSVGYAFGYETGIYKPKPVMVNDKGYWVNVSSPGVTTIVGLRRVTDTAIVSAGWNIIGTSTLPVPVSSISSIPPGLTTSSIYGYRGDVGYFNAETLKAGQGYWVKVHASGKLILSSVAPPSSASAIRIVHDGEQAPAPPDRVTDERKVSAPSAYALSPNYPNPFNPSTKLKYALPATSQVTLEVFNTLGQKVASLQSGVQDAGFYEVIWEASQVPSGLYFARIEAIDLNDPVNTFVEIRKMLLVK